MYHDLQPEGSPVEAGKRPYTLDPAVFGGQLRQIEASTWRVELLRDWAAGARSAEGPGHPVTLILTFDDGDASNHARALPLLLERRMRATFFVTADRVGRPGSLSIAQLRELHAAGMEIGSHTMTHRPPATLSESELRYEVVESKKRLEDCISSPVVSLSSPTGFFNADMSRMAREAGYTSLCGGRLAPVSRSDDLFALPRVPIKRALGERELRLILDLDRRYLGGLRARQKMRNGLKRLLGPGAYVRLRSYLLGRGSGR